MSIRNPKNFREMEIHLVERSDAEKIDAKLWLARETGNWYDASVPIVDYDIHSHSGSIDQRRLILNDNGHRRDVGNVSLVEYDRVRGRLYGLAKCDFQQHVDRLNAIGIETSVNVEEAKLPHLEDSAD